MLRAFQRASDALAAETGTGAGAGDRSADAPPPGSRRAPGREARMTAASPEPLRQRRDGGWRGGACSIFGCHDGRVVAAGVRADGDAWLRLAGAPVTPLSVTFAPWGFRMTVGGLVEGVSYAVGLQPPVGPPRISILPYGPGLLQFGDRILVPCRRDAPPD